MKNTLTTWRVRERANPLNEGDTFAEVCKGIEKLTFDQRYLEKGWKPATRDITPFKEIEFVPPYLRTKTGKPGIYKNILKKREPWKGSLQGFAWSLKDAIKKHLIKVLPQNGVRILMSHSAGYDSRIISLCIRELMDEGANFNIHFRCHQPENQVFYTIMQKAGWDKSMYSGDERLPSANHYDIGLKPPNGWIPFFLVMNYWRDIVPSSAERETVKLSGLGGGELFDYPSRGFKLFRHFEHCENPFINRWLNHFLFNHEYAGQMEAQFQRLIIPYFSLEFLEIASQCRAEWLNKSRRLPRAGGGEIDPIRHAILSHFKYNTLDIPYGPGHAYAWGMTTEEKAKIVSRWNKLRFKREFNLPDFPGLFNGDKINQWEACRYGFALLYDSIMINK